MPTVFSSFLIVCFGRNYPQRIDKEQYHPFLKVSNTSISCNCTSNYKELNVMVIWLSVNVVTLINYLLALSLYSACLKAVNVHTNTYDISRLIIKCQWISGPFNPELLLALKTLLQKELCEECRWPTDLVQWYKRANSTELLHVYLEFSVVLRFALHRCLNFVVATIAVLDWSRCSTWIVVVFIKAFRGEFCRNIYHCYN